jgi:drug/metabolite transporter (DMT)-like permease
MPLFALGLVLAAAVTHATWNYFAKGARGGAAFTFAFCAVAVACYWPVALTAYLWTRPAIGPEALAWVAASGAINLLYFLLLAEGYKWGDLSLVYPLARGTGPALSVIGAMIVFGERPSPLALAGAALVVAGIAVMSWTPGHRRGPDVRRSIAFALATGVCIAAYTLWDNKGVTILAPVLYSFGQDVTRATIMAPVVLTNAAGRAAVRTAFREQRRAVLAVGILSPGAYILVLIALTMAPVSYVAPAREVSILVGALLGLRLLGESDPRRRLIGASAIVGGVCALALG